MKLGLVAITVLLCLTYFVAQATTRYVDIKSTHPVVPYTSWATAATNIQDAINYAAVTDTILVNDGVYKTKWANIGGGSVTRIYIFNFLTVQSVNGPAVTFIEGEHTGSTAINGAYMEAQTVLSGFTLTNGTGYYGGGVFCHAPNCIVTNCIFANNSATYGGGAFGGTVVDCLFTNNVASFSGGAAASNTLINCQLIGNRASAGGGARGSVLTSCILVGNVATANGSGGGAFGGTLKSCVVSNNSAGYGGGVYSCTVNNTLISSNRVTSYGGGAYGGNLNNCIVVSNSTGSFGEGGGADYGVQNNCLLTGNTAWHGAGIANGTANNCTLVGNIATTSGYGAGAYLGQLNNSIIYYNQAVTNADSYYSALTNCCTSLLAYPSIANSFTNDPLFVDPGGDFHLQWNSPCINSGNNFFSTATNDLDGNPRIVGGTVDVGAYEFQSPASMLSYAWLQQYGFPTDGSMDDEDTDTDGMSNRQEWIAGTDPTDVSSLLQTYSVTPTNNFSAVTIHWQSVAGKKYFIQRSADLSAFTTIQANITGQAGITDYTDGNTTNSPKFFYRVGVE